MKAKDLIKKLQEIDPEAAIVIPKDLYTLSPVKVVIKAEKRIGDNTFIIDWFGP